MCVVRVLASVCLGSTDSLSSNTVSIVRLLNLIDVGSNGDGMNFFKVVWVDAIGVCSDTGSSIS